MHIKISTCTTKELDEKVKKDLMEYFKTYDIPIRIFFHYHSKMPIIYDNPAWYKMLKKERR